MDFFTGVYQLALVILLIWIGNLVGGIALEVKKTRKSMEEQNEKISAELDRIWRQLLAMDTVSFKEYRE